MPTVLAALMALAPVHPHRDADCREMQIPVGNTAHVYGQLCVPRGHRTRTVQLLVPGGTYNHFYFDWPQDPDHYSYVTHALDAGYATFDVDRLGTGRSTLPPSALDTAGTGTEALHQVITDLRTQFTTVVWVGHSLGSVMGWIEAQKYHDIDAFVLTGLLHETAADKKAASEAAANEATSKAAEAADEAAANETASKAADDVPPGFVRAMDDPKFRGRITDPGYLTTAPGVRSAGFYYAPNADPAVMAEDERLKDLTTDAEAAVESTLDGDASRAITVPTLLAVGDHDAAFCGDRDCTPQALLASEGPYYSPGARLRVLVVKDSGHDIQLHRNAPATDAAIQSWIGAMTFASKA